MGQLTVIFARADEGKSLYTIRKLAEQLAKKRTTNPLLVSESGNLLLRSCGYAFGVHNNIGFIRYPGSSELASVLLPRINEAIYDSVFIDGSFHIDDTESLSFMVELSKTHDVYATVQLPWSAFDSDMIDELIPPPEFVSVASRIVLLMGEGSGIVAEYRYVKDNSQFTFCRYYYVDTAPNDTIKLNTFGEELPVSGWLHSEEKPYIPELCHIL